MIANGQHTEHGVYCPSPVSFLDNFKDFLHGKRVLDIGSGRGYVVEKLLSLGADAYGIEINTELYNESVCRERIVNKDIFDESLKDYDVLYYYIGGCFKEKELFDKILKEFKGAIICYSG